MHKVIPGILEKDWLEIEKKIEIAKEFTNTIHIDIIDGIFADNITFMDPKPFSKYSKDFNLEVHLMVDNPLQYLEGFANAGFKRFIGHIEKMENLEEFVAKGQMLGEVGLALDIQTPVDSINVSFDDLDLILLMGVKAGKSGQEFVPDVLAKIASIREKNSIPIEVDGGINDKTIIDIKNAGADEFVVTSALFSNQNPKVAYETLNKLLN